jgi:iron complex transport system ATP-binding protein
MEENMSVWLRVDQAILGYSKVPVTPEPLSFELSESGITVLLGRNGAGKTTLLRSILDRSLIQKGSVKTGSAFGNLAYVPQEPVFPSHLNLRDCLALAFLPALGWLGKLSNLQNDEVDELLAQFMMAGLQKKPLGSLSPGERQRAFLARALLQKPKVLLLDEPTNHLDPEARFFFWNALQGAVSLKDTRVLACTHDLEFAQKKASWICAFKEGRLVYHAKSKGFWNVETIAAVFGEGPARDWMKR